MAANGEGGDGGGDAIETAMEKTGGRGSGWQREAAGVIGACIWQARNASTIEML